MITSRPINKSDFPRMEQEIRSDACHKEWLKSAFFVAPNTQSIVFEDEETVIMFARLSSVLRLHVQFCDVSKQKIARCLVTQFSDIVKRAKANGYSQIIFDTESPALAKFCQRYLGFTASGHEQVLWLEQVSQTPLESTVCQESTSITRST
jgi:hypothetical protein